MGAPHSGPNVEICQLSYMPEHAAAMCSPALSHIFVPKHFDWVRQLGLTLRAPKRALAANVLVQFSPPRSARTEE